MRRIAAIAVFTTSVGALAAAHGCGPPCVDDRCSLTPVKPQVTRVDYTNPSGGGSSTPTSGSGSAAPATGSDGNPVAMPGSAGSAMPAIGNGSATTPPATGSATPPATGSATPPVTPKPPATPTSASKWQAWDGDQFKMHVITKAAVSQNTTVKVEFVKTPSKTPFVITLKVRPPGGQPTPEAAWNDCPENKIACDAKGTKSHTTKTAGNVLIAAGINWTVTSVVDDGKGTLVTWTNNLSREIVSLRLK